MINQKVSIFTDGSSKGNPGQGGWGTIIEFDNMVKEIGGHDSMTTNNKMEMTAVISALRYVLEHIGNESITVINSDSNYVINGITNWIYGWEKNNWKNSQKKDVLNRELWEEMIDLVRKFKIKPQFVKVKGHSGIIENERADTICTSYADSENIVLFSGKKEDYNSFLKSLE